MIGVPMEKMTTTNGSPVVRVEGLRHAYGGRPALQGIDFDVNGGEVFALLGPNGGGKTTLFRILATLLRPDAGRASLLGHDVVRDARAVRESIGVVFQSPALDRKLTVRENLEVQGRLYGLGGARLREAIDEMLRRVRLLDRARDRVETLSGGLMRRAEIAKGLLHRPRVLLLDEPSTGLDPGARSDLWEHLSDLRARDGVTILLTTHLMEEAERCDRLGILSQGRLVATGTPRQLKSEIGGDVIAVVTPDPGALREEIERRFGGPATVVDGTVRLERPRGHELIPRLVEAFPDRIDSVTIGRPTLLDVFIHKTGHRFWGEEEA
jgi:ABC-2 type transport system ATP-binding protein